MILVEHLRQIINQSLMYNNISVVVVVYLVYSYHELVPRIRVRELGLVREP